MDKSRPDGDLPSTLDAFSDAIRALCAPQTTVLGGRTMVTVSRWWQLQGAKAGEQVNGGGGGGDKSQPPCWLDAIDLAVRVERGIESWGRRRNLWHPGSDCGTPGRLYVLEETLWRPQDCHALAALTKKLVEWTVAIDELLDPPRRWTLPAACPATGCGKAFVYRRDSGGDMVRQPALQIGPEGCVCGACHAKWPPDQFVWLAGLIGAVPDSVLG